jgi:hypothetical protein
MPQAGFEPATPSTKRPQTNALDRAATGIGQVGHNVYYKKLPAHHAASGCVTRVTGLEAGERDFLLLLAQKKGWQRSLLPRVLLAHWSCNEDKISRQRKAPTSLPRGRSGATSPCKLAALAAHWRPRYRAGHCGQVPSKTQQTSQLCEAFECETLVSRP